MFNALFKLWITTALAALVWFGYTSHTTQNGALKTPSLPTFEQVEKNKASPLKLNPFKSKAYASETPLKPKSVKKTATLPKAKQDKSGFFSKFGAFNEKKAKTTKPSKQVLSKPIAETFSNFPGILRENNWVVSNAGLPACQLKPSDTYSFASRQSNLAGIGCHLLKGGINPTYQLSLIHI